MKSKLHSSRDRSGASQPPAAGYLQKDQTFPSLNARDWFGLILGMFLGLALIKFGNPVILDSKIEVPQSISDLWAYAWPLSWTHWIFVLLACVGAWVIFQSKMRWPATRWLWVLPVVWFGWQLVSTFGSEDSALTNSTVWQFAGCLGCYLVGALALGNDGSFRLMLIGLLAGLAFCLVRAVDQRLFEFPQERQFLIENEKSNWTNLPPAMVLEMKQNGMITTTNGMDIATPMILQKFEKARVFGTLVYPNALAGAVLLLFPVALVLAVNSTRRFRPVTRWLAIGLTVFLGSSALYWTGSKSGWLIAIGIVGVWLFRLNWSARMKWLTLLIILGIGLGVFGIRFRSYFAHGASSVGARFDYWRAAGRTALNRPVLGSGPGTFQHPYARLKAPESEMARLTHNDYLEQFSDSGFIGGLSYAAWIVLLMSVVARRVWRNWEPIHFALFVGCLGWFIQGLSEFGLYVPALAWPAFVLSGCLLSLTRNPVDNPAAAG